MYVESANISLSAFGAIISQLEARAMTRMLESFKTGKRIQKSERVAVRLTPDVKERLEYAAELTGRSVSDFVISSALEVAQNQIDRHAYYRLAEEDREIFLSALSKPPTPNKALRAAARKYRKQTRG